MTVCSYSPLLPYVVYLLNGIQSHFDTFYISWPYNATRMLPFCHAWSNMNISSSVGLAYWSEMLSIFCGLKGQWELMSDALLPSVSCLLSPAVSRVYRLTRRNAVWCFLFFLISVWTLLLLTVGVMLLWLIPEASVMAKSKQETTIVKTAISLEWHTCEDDKKRHKKKKGWN